MACNFPRSVFQDVNPETGEISSVWRNLLYYDLSPDDLRRHYAVLPAPCNRCAGCANDRARTWADRCVLELDHSKTAVFVTLTYSEDHVPRVAIRGDSQFYDDSVQFVSVLDKPAFQKFMKRLRKYFEPREVRFFSCGEYGSSGFRPHYHAILFGLSLADFGTLVPVAQNDFGQVSFASSVLSKLWTFGISSVSDVSYSTMSYVAHYTTKKMVSTFETNPYLVDSAIPPEFALMSRRPGIAGYYLQDHPDLALDVMITYTDNFLSNGRRISLPRYLLDRACDFPDYAAVKSSRSDLASAVADAELRRTSLTPSDYFRQKDFALRSRLKRLSRD